MTPEGTKAGNTAVDEKLMKALNSAVDKIRQDHGEGAVMDMSAKPKAVDSIPTGSLPLDIALGIGGIPEGRIVEIFGPESSGKTTLCYHMMAEVQRRGQIAAFIDTEHAMDAKYASDLGVDIPALVVSQPDYGEQALQIVEVLANSSAVSLIVVDSVAALTPKSEIDGQIGDSSVGVLARLMSQACRKLAGVANRNNVTIVFTNQIREKIGVMFGSPETQPGGRALKFYSSQRLDIRRIETIKDAGDAVANRVRVKVVKNKVAPPFTQAEFEIAYGKGVDKNGALLDFCTDKSNPVDLVTKAGAFYTFTTTGEKAQGAAKAKAYLAEHPEIAEEIDTAVRAFYFPEDSDEEGPADDSEAIAAEVDAEDAEKEV